MIRDIRWMVYAVALTLTILPTFAAFYAAREIVESAVHLGFNQRISSELEKSGSRLKELAKAKPADENRYREEFTHLQEVRSAYDTLLSSTPILSFAYMQIFFLVSGFALGSALLLAWWLNRRIIRSHNGAIALMEKAKERSIYLEQSESWRLFAQKLVHEIKNPLTPVQVMVGRIPQKYISLHPQPSGPFQSVLAETKTIVDEEIAKVNNWVEAFSKFARMPTPDLKNVGVEQVLTDFQRQYGDYWDNLSLKLKFEAERKITLNCDPALLKQALFNLVKNSAEAASGPVEVVLHAKFDSGAGVSIEVRDNGPGLSAQVAKHLFRPYVSEKGERGMGLGLAIARKILIEHGGDLQNLPAEKGCLFSLNFPKPEAVN